MIIRDPAPGSRPSPVTRLALMRLPLAGGLLLVWSVAAWVTPPEARSDGQSPPQAKDPLPSILVDVNTATWKPRGRVLFDVTATVRNKLSGAGFPIVRDAAEPHDLTLTLDYREERGRQYDFTTYQTIVTGRFLLERRGSSPLLDLTVQERSGEELGGTPPYVDAIQRFETHPSVFFLGEIVRGRLRGDSARAPALIAGLRRELQAESAGIDPLSTPHTMTVGDTTIPALARHRAIRELGRLGEPEAVPFLRELLSHKDPNIQHAAGLALAQIESQETAERR